MKQIAYNRSTRTDKIKYIVIHDTGNEKRGANANGHFNFFNSGDRQSSADFFVDDKQALQVNDYNKFYTWHCGDGGGRYGITNNNSIGVELCVNADGNYNVAFNRMVELVKELMTELNMPAERVVRHYDASRKNCPASMSANNWALWNTFKGQLLFNNGKENEEMIYNYIDENMPEWARPTIQKLVNKGYLKGNENGELGLSDTMLKLLVINDRVGLYDAKGDK